MVKRMKISLVMPVYNEQEILAEVILKYKTDLQQIVKNLGAGASYEFIAVNDGSTDASVDILGKEAKSNSRFKIINFDQRYGKEAAITAGFEMADGDIVIVADVDLLNPLGVLERLVSEHLDGANIVYGYRERIGWESLKDRVNYAFVKLGTKIFQIEGEYMGKANVQSFSRATADIIREFPERNKLMRAMDTWAGFEIETIGYSSNYSKDEMRTKMADARQKDREQGLPRVYRSTAREHSPSKIYSFAALVMAFALVVGWVALSILVDNFSLLWHFVLLVTLVIMLLCSVMFFARAVMIKRIGKLHQMEDGAMYIVKGVVNG